MPLSMVVIALPVLFDWLLRSSLKGMWDTVLEANIFSDGIVGETFCLLVPVALFGGDIISCDMAIYGGIELLFSLIFILLGF